MFDSNNLKGYTLLKTEELGDISSKGYLLSHDKTKARILLISNDDDNKVFSIGFRTPPTDSTGVPHIMEHSVLCGSRKFPVKDPFVELIKGSLNTFLNAMTFPDKTLYPVASCNDKDFKNLTDVYLDAVFYPNIYKHEEIFKQEGWHYEMMDADSELTINGVVYNEMKGAFSSPDDVLEREVFNSLFPDSPYGVESGGDPDVIPKLTYEQFLDFHKKYYHPTNSYIYFYGDMDFNERLEWLDKEYLSKFEKIDIDSHIVSQESFKKAVRIETEYGITEEEELDGNTYLSKNYIIDSALNKELAIAFEILDYAIIGAPGARLKQRLLDEGIGNDVYSSYESGILQPYYSIVAKEASREQEKRFYEIIDEELKQMAKEGIDKKALLAGINMFEFKYREADFGSYPKGLMYGLLCYESWLYDDNEPVLHIEQNDVYAKLRKEVNGRYFEEIIEKYLLGNEHSSMLILNPKRGLNTIKDKALADKLAEYKNSLSKDEIDAIVADTVALKKYQEEPSSQEDLKSIPLLSIEDIKKETAQLKNEEVKLGKVPAILHEINSNGIGYLGLLFDVSNIDYNDITAMSVLSLLYTFVSTKEHHYAELFNEININCGGISPTVATFPNYAGKDDLKIAFGFAAKLLSEQTEFVFNMLEELIFDTLFDDKKRILELLMMTRSRMQASLMSSGHSAAVKRALSHISKAGIVSEKLAGIESYRYIDELINDYDNRFDEFVLELKRISKLIFTKDNLYIDYTGARKDLEKCVPYIEKLYDRLSDEKMSKAETQVMPTKLSEAFKTSGQVQYVAKCGNFIKAGLPYTGALKVLRTILSSDYLWINVRVMGGAYGCMCAMPKSGDSYLVSYRDPHINNTLKIYDECAEYIKNIEIEDRDMTKYIIGTISDLDIPLTPRGLGSKSMSAYMGGISTEDMQKERDEILSCTVDDIRALYKYIESIVNTNEICCIGAEGKINENSEIFDKVENLF